jgi:hypothetical protein
MSQKSLRRYTDITALSYLLTNERITLLWTDGGQTGRFPLRFT